MTPLAGAGVIAILDDMQSELVTRMGSAYSWAPPIGRNWNADDGRAMLAACRASNESVTAFLSRLGITAQRYHYWRSKLGAARTTPGSPPGFREVRLLPARGDQESTESVTVGNPVTVLAGSLRFLVHADTCEKALVKILKSISLAEGKSS